MISIKNNVEEFKKETDNIIDFSLGFFEGVEKGKENFAENLANEIIDSLKNFIDSNARVSPETLHHMYEWHSVGSPDARLFNVEYTTTRNGISLDSIFTQSSSIKEGSNVPFYNKAEIMEKGLAVRIVPTRSEVLAFQDGGETIFTKSGVTVINPGGQETTGSYEQIFNQFFSSYFSQSFLLSSGVMASISDLSDFSANFYRSTRSGRSAGVKVGYRFMSKAGDR
jgi:hypothetical protein